MKRRAERLGATRDDLWLHAETSLPHILDAIERIRPELVVIDSIQTVSDPGLGSLPGSVGQVRGCAQRLVNEAKERDVSIVLVGHVTKDGGLAGPRVLEHVVDTVLQFEGDRHHALRLLRASKHRFGPTNELGLFEMAGAGLIPENTEAFFATEFLHTSGSLTKFGGLSLPVALFTAIVGSLSFILIIKFGVGGIWEARDRFWPRVYDALTGEESAPKG